MRHLTILAVIAALCVVLIFPAQAFAAENQPPTAVIAATPTAGSAPLTVSFTGTESYDGDGFVTFYQWSFGDGTDSLRASISHTYLAAGTYTVKLTVTDNYGMTGSSTVVITVTGSGMPDPDTLTSPSNLGAKAVSSSVTLKWTDNSGDESGFYIERGVKTRTGTNYSRIGTVGPNETAFTQTMPKGTYYYRVQAFSTSTGKVSGYSNTASVRIR